MAASEPPQYDSLGLKEIKVTLQEPGVAVVHLDRAKQRNTVTHLLGRELIQVFDLFDRDDRVRAVILTAEHTAPAFCSGADISKGWGMLFDGETQREGDQAHRDGGGEVSLAILRCRKITIVAVNGNAAGMGMTALQLPFDFRFVWAGAKLVFPFVRRGIAPEAISSYLLPRLVGQSRAASLLLTGHVYAPDSAHINALYHAVLPTREEVFPAALAFAKELGGNTSQTAVAFTKALLLHPGSIPEENHLLDSRVIKILGSNADGEEGSRSFMERRQPKFTDVVSKDMTAWYPWWSIVDVRHRRSKL